MEKKMKSMIDNRMVKDSHQEGISRVIQRKSERDPKAQGGKMSATKGTSESNWKRSAESLTPRKA